MDQAALRAFVQRSRYAVVSSLSPDGSPQSALIGIACSPALEIVFDTLSEARKVRNLRADPRCSLVVGWTGEQTLQLEGSAQELAGDRLVALRELYLDHWPECRSHVGWPGITYIVVTPTWLRFSDYNRQPPLIEETAVQAFTPQTAQPEDSFTLPSA